MKRTEDLLHPRLRVRSQRRPCPVKRREFVVVRRLHVRRLVVECPAGHLRCALRCAHHLKAIAFVSLPTEGKRLAMQEKELEKKTRKRRKQQEERTQETNVESDAHERNEKHQEEENTKHEEE